MTAAENTTRIIEASDKISKVFASMESFVGDMNLSKTQLLALEYISKQKEITMSNLANNLCIGFSTATSIIDRLIEKELVIRERNHGDRRVVKVSLSNKGKKTVSDYQEQKIKSFEKMTEVLTESEQEIFVSILDKIANGMQNGN